MSENNNLRRLLITCLQSFPASRRHEATMDDSVSRCRIYHHYWQFEELHVRRAQCSATSLQRLLVRVLLVRRITALQSVISGIELL